MKRCLGLCVKYCFLAGASYLCARTGEYIAGGSPDLLSINAFLFLVGLGGALALLSPPHLHPRHARPGVLRPRAARSGAGRRPAWRSAWTARPVVSAPSSMILVRTR
jgi:hypothetical protein